MENTTEEILAWNELDVGVCANLMESMHSLLEDLEGLESPVHHELPSALYNPMSAISNHDAYIPAQITLENQHLNYTSTHEGRISNYNHDDDKPTFTSKDKPNKISRGAGVRSSHHHQNASKTELHILCMPKEDEKQVSNAETSSTSKQIDVSHTVNSNDNGRFRTPISHALKPNRNLKCLHCNSHDSMGDMSKLGVTKEKKECPPSKVQKSRNAIAEKLRRKVLNDRLLSLRALVPNISKMDRASIIIDAVSYMRELQGQLEEMQNKVSDLEAMKEALESGILEPKEAFTWGHHKSQQQHHITKMAVSCIQGHIYHLSIHCKKNNGVLVQLIQALEDPKLEILSANIRSLNDHILNTFVIEVKEAHLICAGEDVQHIVKEIFLKYGISS